MQGFIKLTLLGAGLALAATGAMAQDDAVKARRELMKNVSGKNAKLASQLTKGEIPYNAEIAKAAMMSIHEVPDKFVKMFPKGTDSEQEIESEASPKIWTDMDGFQAAAGKLKLASAAAAEAATKGPGQFAVAFEHVFKACKGCHDTYRVEKEKH